MLALCTYVRRVSTSRAWPWKRVRGGTRPPPAPGPKSRRLLQGGKSRQRLSWEPLTSLGATTAPPSSGSFGAATHRRPAPAPNIYPHPGGRGGGAGRELGPGGAPAPATPPLRRRDEWLPARGGVATTRPDTSAPRAQATRRARRGRPRRSGAGRGGASRVTHSPVQWGWREGPVSRWPRPPAS